MLYATSLLFCLYAFGSGAPFWTLLALHVGISVVAGLVPVPGLDTAVSTLSMSGALVAVGVDGPAAAAAVVANTLVNEYVPAIPGWFATNRIGAGRPALTTAGRTDAQISAFVRCFCAPIRNRVTCRC